MDIASFVRDCIQWLWDPINRRYHYLADYEENLRSLADKTKRLEARTKDVEENVKIAQSKDQVIKNEVREWQDRVGTFSKELESFDNEVQENKRCCISGCLPHCGWRCKMSKQAKEKASEIDAVLTEQRFEDVSISGGPRRTPVKFKWSVSMEKFQLLSSTEEAMNKVMEALRNEEILVIGVHGMGGVGKTTMVKQVAVQAIDDGLFDHVVMATVSQTDQNVRRIQNQIAEGFGFVLGPGNQESRAARVKNKIMEEKRVLIILDDIWRMLDLKNVGIPYGTELKNCKSKILLTTRLENVCHRMECREKINLHHLPEEDAWKFFKNTAGTNFASPEFEAVGRLVAQECKGLPIALVAVAKALGDKEMDEWEKAVRRLRRSMPVNGDDDRTVFNCIKLSYDFLKNQEKKCFLLCCLFPEDHNIGKEEIARYGLGMGFFQEVNTMEEARGDADTIAKKLIASGLLLDGDKKEQVKMHDVIRDVAILITSSSSWSSAPGNDNHHQEQQVYMVQAGLALKDWPRRDTYKKYTAISLMSNEIQRLPDCLNCPKLQTLLLQDNNNLKEIPATFFKMMVSLRVLDLNGTQASSLPSSIELLKNLRTLYLDRCKFTDVTILGALEKLEILSLRESFIDTLPEDLGKLSNLRMLDLTLSYNINKIPANLLTRLSYLEEFYLKGSFAQWDHDDDQVDDDDDNDDDDDDDDDDQVDDDDDDDQVDDDDDDNDDDDDDDQVDDDDDDDQVDDDDDDNDDDGSTEAGSSTTIACFEELIDLPCLNVVKVDIAEVKCLPRNASSIPNWAKFDICICNQQFTRMMNVQLSNKTTTVYSRNLLLDVAMNNLPDWFIEVVCEKAEKLIYSECSGLNMVEEFDRGRLTGLKSLVVEQCPEVYSLMQLGPDYSTVNVGSGLPVLESLEELRIHHMDFMQEICVGELPSGSLARLRFLEVQQCNYLTNSLLPSNLIKRLHNLERLRVIGNSVERVFGFEGLGPMEEGGFYLEKLREMRLDSLSKLANIWTGPVHLANFSNLMFVSVINCKELRNLFPVSFMSQGLLQLEDLWIEGCSEMVEIISNDLGSTAVDKVKLPKLKTLALTNLPMLTSFYPGNAFLECPSLEHLHVHECHNFIYSTADFHSLKLVQENDEQNLKLLKKRMGEEN